MKYSWYSFLLVADFYCKVFVFYPSRIIIIIIIIIIVIIIIITTTTNETVTNINHLKVKFNLERTTKVQRGSRVIVILFL